jgi:hypothetical protein
MNYADAREPSTSDSEIIEYIMLQS